MTFHWLRFRTIAHATEDSGLVRDALKFAAGDDAEISASLIEGQYGNPIEILETEISSRKGQDDFFRKLLLSVQGNFSGETSSDEDFTIPDFFSPEDISRRLDDECVLYIRLDKQEALCKRLVPVTHDDVITVRAKIICYPASKKGAEDALAKYLHKL